VSPVTVRSSRWEPPRNPFPFEISPEVLPQGFFHVTIGAGGTMTEQKIDPELRDDRDETVEEVPTLADLPEYDATQFELPDDYEYDEEAEDAD
jgi:hypothetical protein